MKETGTGLDIVRVRERGEWKSDSKSPATLLKSFTSSTTKEIGGSIVLSEREFQSSSKATLMISGSNADVGWPSGTCDKVRTSITTDVIQVSTEDCASDDGRCWVSLNNAPGLLEASGASGSQVVTFAKKESLSKLKLSISSSSVTWSKGDKKAPPAQPVHIKMSDMLRGQLFRKESRKIVLRARLNFKTECLNSTNAVVRDVTATSCKSRMLMIVQTRRVGQWKFGGTPKHPMQSDDFYKEKMSRFTDTVIRTPTETDLSVLRMYRTGNGAMSAANLTFVPIYALLVVNTRNTEKKTTQHLTKRLTESFDAA